ncbi:MAG: sigma 54-interacting transcriptional regulator, partial [Planctomycetota bacterium]
RAEDCDVVLSDPYVSRHHFSLRGTDDGWRVESDSSAKNPVLVNGEPHGNVELEVGDRIDVASTRITFLCATMFGDEGESSVLVLDSPEAVNETLTLGSSDGRSDFLASQEPESRAKLEALLAIGEALADGDHTESFFQRILRLLTGALNARRGFAWLGDPRSRSLDEVVAFDASGTDTGTIAMSRSVLDKIQIERTAVLVRNAEVDLGALHGKSVSEVGIRSFIAAPMIIGDEVEGVLYLDRLGASPAVNERDLAFLQTVARECALGIQSARYRETLQRENLKLRRFLSQEREFVASAPAMKELLRRTQLVAESESAAMILGETGTGKEHVARAIHEASPRRDGPFVTFNCATCPPNLIDAKLFGTRPGGFTEAQHFRGKFEVADGGTLFLDEVGEMPLEVQAKLLRVQQDRAVEPIGSETPVPVDVRIVSATLQDLNENRAEVGFRDDLYYRLAETMLHVPPLRERGEDIVEIALQLLPEGFRFEPSAKRALLTYPWPGNIRELDRAMRHILLERAGPRVRLKDLPSDIAGRERRPVLEVPERTLDQVVENHIRRVVAQSDGNKTQAARVLGISRETLYQKLKQYSIQD